MGLSKFREQIITQLEKEAELEKRDVIRENQESKIETVLSKIFKEPHLHDPLLCTLDIETWEKFRSRVKSVLEEQVNPSNLNCAESYLFVFASKNDRQSLVEKIQKSRDSISVLPKMCTDIFTTNQYIRELEQEKNLLHSTSDNISEIVDELKTFNTRLKEIESEYNKISETLNELRSKRDEIKNEISAYESFINQTKNSRSRIELATNIDNVLNGWENSLKPLILDNLERITTKKFIDLADKRFSGGKIIIQNSSKPEAKPVFINKNNETELFESMAGFERRSFGISYSLALTELTNYKAPLVIDTPLGNADSAYRQRLLLALSKANLDQIIILTHDEEITEDLHNTVLAPRITDDNGTYFLVKYDLKENQSIVCPNEFFF
jgi:DNA sulfur modification protein DndD